jgi:hypothetical protein
MILKFGHKMKLPQRHIRTAALFCMVQLCIGQLVLIRAVAQPGKNDFARITKLLRLPAPFTISQQGKIEAAKIHWQVEQDADGTDLFTSAKGNARIAVLKDKSGSLESVTAFSLKSPQAGETPRTETDDSLAFKDQTLLAYTRCESSKPAASPERRCLTVTRALCSSLVSKGQVGLDSLHETDSFEMKALAIILTLRGADHQLDNVVHFGNRLGLKSPEQSTRGQIVAAAAKTGAQSPNTPEVVKQLKDMCKNAEL